MSKKRLQFSTSPIKFPPRCGPITSRCCDGRALRLLCSYSKRPLARCLAGYKASAMITRRRSAVPTAPLFVGTANRVYAIDRGSGRILWNVSLNDRFFKMGSSFVNLEFDGESLFVATFGDLYCLDPQSGEIRWKVPLKVPLQGTMANPVTFAASVSTNREAARKGWCGETGGITSLCLGPARVAR